MNRRGFLSALSLGAVTAPAAAMTVQPKIESDAERDGPLDGSQNITFRMGTKLIQQSPNGFFVDQYEEHKETKLAVGKDGNLWVKTEDKNWKRIMVE